MTACSALRAGTWQRLSPGNLSCPAIGGPDEHEPRLFDSWQVPRGKEAWRWQLWGDLPWCAFQPRKATSCKLWTVLADPPPSVLAINVQGPMYRQGKRLASSWCAAHSAVVKQSIDLQARCAALLCVSPAFQHADRLQLDMSGSQKAITYLAPGSSCTMCQTVPPMCSGHYSCPQHLSEVAPRLLHDLCPGSRLQCLI